MRIESIKIGIDVDGVIVNLVGAMRPLLSKACGYTVTDDQIYCFDIGKALNIESEMESIWDEVYNSGLLREAPALDGAIEGMSKIKEHYIWLITGRPKNTRKDTKYWLKRNGIKYDKLDVGSDYKGAICNKNIDIFIEDNFEQAQLTAKAGIYTLLFDHPWNRNEVINNRCKRVKSWNEVICEVKQFQKLAIKKE